MSYIDPTLRPRTSLEERIIRRAREMGLSLRRLRPGSNAVTLYGPGGTHTTVRELEALSKADFEAAIGRQRADGRR